MKLSRSGMGGGLPSLGSVNPHMFSGQPVLVVSGLGAGSRTLIGVEINS